MTKPHGATDVAEIAASSTWFESLWVQFSADVYAYAARRVGAVEAPDVVEETFVVVWRHRDEKRDVTLPWLLGVARHVIATTQRGDGRRSRLLQRVRFHAHDEPSDPSAVAIAGWSAREALAALPEKDRELIMLCAWEGLSAKEAAHVLGLSHAAVRARRSRALRRLARLLAEQEIDE